jgi:hypothetical protein
VFEKHQRRLFGVTGQFLGLSSSNTNRFYGGTSNLRYYSTCECFRKFQGIFQIAVNREASIAADREGSRLLSTGFITSRIIRRKTGPSGKVLEEFSPSLLGSVIHETTLGLLKHTLLEAARKEASAIHARQPSVTPELPDIVAAIAALGVARTAARRAVRQAFLDFVSGYDARAASNAAEDGFRAVTFGPDSELNKASDIVSKVVYRFVRSQGSSTAGGISGHTASVDALYKATATAICYVACSPSTPLSESFLTKRFLRHPTYKWHSKTT